MRPRLPDFGTGSINGGGGVFGSTVINSGIVCKPVPLGVPRKRSFEKGGGGRGGSNGNRNTAAVTAAAATTQPVGNVIDATNCSKTFVSVETEFRVMRQ